MLVNSERTSKLSHRELQDAYDAEKNERRASDIKRELMSKRDGQKIFNGSNKVRQSRQELSSSTKPNLFVRTGMEVERKTILSVVEETNSLSPNSKVTSQSPQSQNKSQKR